MNYGLRYSLALIIGVLLAALWLWIILPIEIPTFALTSDLSEGDIFIYKASFTAFPFSILSFIIWRKVVNGGILPDFSRPMDILVWLGGSFSRLFSAPFILIFWILLLIAIPSYLLIFFGSIITLFSLVGGNLSFEDRNNAINLFWFFVLTTIVPATLLLLPQFYVRKKEELSEHSRFRSWFAFGKGGSARWSGARSFRKHIFDKFKKNVETASHWNNDRSGFLSDAIYFGKTLFEDTFWSNHIAIKDDAHLLTVGCIGSGKSATALWSNLAMYKGSMLIIDPKGEHAQKTYWRRRNNLDLPEGIQPKTTKYFIYQNTHILDPFGSTTDLPTSKYNPLSDIDIESEDAEKLLSYISDACVISESSKDVHFVETASNLLEGVIAHVLSKFPKENHNLPFVCDLLIGLDPEIGAADPEKFEELLTEMRLNNVAGGIAQEAASRLDEMGANERGSVLSTLARSVKWITNRSMRKHLSESDFSLKILQGESTVYVVLPFDYMKDQARWLRLITNMGLGLTQAAAEKGRKPDPPVLFVLDEFPMMGGKLKRIEEGVVTLRGAGVKFWIVVQSIVQLQEDYKEKWHTFVSSSTVQLFGITDTKTADWASQMLGEHILKEKERIGYFKKRTVSEKTVPLLTAREIMDLLGKSSPMQIIKPMEGFPMRLHRLAYKQIRIDGNNFKGLPLDGHFEE